MSFERFDELSADHSTGGELEAAQNTLGRLVRIDPETVTDPLELANLLQGASRSITTVAQSQALETQVGHPQSDDALFEPTIAQSASATQIFEYSLLDFGLPQKMFSTMTYEPYGSYMRLEVIHGDKTNLLCDIVVPDDKVIDDLFMQPSILWEVGSIYASDQRTSEFGMVYNPFNSWSNTPGSTCRYFGILQELNIILSEGRIR